MRSVNPTTGETLAEYPDHDRAEAIRRLERAASAQAGWGASPVDERAPALARAARLLEERRDELARLMAREMGKPLAQGRSEVEKCAWTTRHFAEHAARFLADEEIETEARRSYVAYRPLGLVLAIMPWNFPLWQVLRFSAPALMAGNGVLLKHAPNVPGCALALEELLADAGLPSGLFISLFVDVELVGELIGDPRIAAVTLTGSTRAGREVAARAGRHLKKTVLELGGSDPYVVLADADLETALEACVKSRLQNTGQSCIAAKRFIVAEPLHGELLSGLVERFRQARAGDPLEEETELGPLARPDLRENLHRQVRGSVAAGAELLLGGELPQGPGAFYPPTVLDGVRPGMPAWDEELFGPVAAVRAAADDEQAIRLANETSFGLGAAVFTRDRERGRRIAERELRAGAVAVNDLVRSDPRLPFGGIQESGYGRELGRQGILEFVNVKSVVVGPSDGGSS